MGKRLIRAVICVCLLLALAHAGMGQGAGAKTGDDREYPHIIVTYQYLEHSNQSRMEEVTEAVNAISRSEIGVEIEFKFVNALDSFTDYPVWLSKGEPIDLMLLNYQNIRSYVDRDMLLPLDGLLEEYGADIGAICRTERNLYSGTVIDGKIYGCGIHSYSNASGGGLWIAEDYLAEIAFPYEKEHIYSMEELDILFARLKEEYPDRYPLGQITAGNAFTTAGYYGQTPLAVGGDMVSGVLEGERVCDFFESDAYYEFLRYMRKWYMKGYIYPEAAYTDASNMELLREGITMSFPSGSQPGMITEEQIPNAVCLRTSAVTYGNESSSTGIFWTVPSTAREPEAAMKFLNLMYSDARIVNLLRYGIEGKDYVLADEAQGTIAYPQDADGQRYYNDLGVYGNLTLAYEPEGMDYREEREEYFKSALLVGEEYEGFLFDTAKVELCTSRVQEVLRSYLPVLESGSIPLAGNYEQFVNALREAGIDELVEEKQRQLDAWLAQKPE